MSFETGGGMEDPLGDGDDEDEDMDMSVDVDESSQERDESSGTEDEQSSDSLDREVSQDADPVDSVRDFSDINVNGYYRPEEIAEVLMDERYHDEDPPIPYAMWRSGSSTGRRRMSVELNPEIDHLLEAAMGEFRERYGCKINKSDLREMALVYGLMNLDDGVFEIAEEWGLQYNG